MESLIEEKLEEIYTNDCIFNVNYVGANKEKIYNVYVLLNIGPRYDFEFRYKFDDYFTFDYNIDRLRKIVDLKILKLFTRY